ncbi:MAG: photosystem I reaction center subunit X [Oculatellaceae cyanobacterium Prado106]|nr:photosystem I reaction center subunit X [Oculatellaceae cyanobacterium Prado106]
MLIHLLGLLAQLDTHQPIEYANWLRPLLISGSCLFVLLVASRTIQHPHVGPKMPLGPFSSLFNHISTAGFLAAMSFGHIIGTLLVLRFATP